MDFKIWLTETVSTVPRGTKDFTSRIPWLQLKKYANSDMYVSFTEEFAYENYRLYKDKDIEKYQKSPSSFKLGINPKSKYDTPIGIYAYPVDYVIKVNGNVPFAGKSPNLIVFYPKNQSKILHMTKDNKIEFERKMIPPIYLFPTKNLQQYLLHQEFTSFPDKELIELMIEDEMIKEIVMHKLGSRTTYSPGFTNNLLDFNVLKIILSTKTKNAEYSRPITHKHIESFISKLKTVLKELAEDKPEIFFDGLFKEIKIPKIYPFKSTLEKDFGKEEVEKIIEEKNIKIRSNLSYFWNVPRLMFQDLFFGGFTATWTKYYIEKGIHGFHDHGTGTIHENEPTQAVFFNASFLQTVDVIKQSMEGKSLYHRNYSKEYFKLLEISNKIQSTIKRFKIKYNSMKMNLDFRQKSSKDSLDNLLDEFEPILYKLFNQIKDIDFPQNKGEISDFYSLMNATNGYFYDLKASLPYYPNAKPRMKSFMNSLVSISKYLYILERNLEKAKDSSFFNIDNYNYYK